MFNEFESEIITLTDEKGEIIIADVVDRLDAEDGKS